MAFVLNLPRKGDDRDHTIQMSLQRGAVGEKLRLQVSLLSLEQSTERFRVGRPGFPVTESVICLYD